MSNPDPRQDPDCTECVTGRYEYDGQTTTTRGEMQSRYKCGDCGHEVTVE